MPTFSRRALILGGACALSAASAFPFFAGANETITVDEFRALSARLTGASLTDLNATAAAKLLDGFLSMGRGAGSRARSPPILELRPGRSPTTSSPPGIPAITTRAAGLGLDRSHLARCCGTRSISPSRLASAAALTGYWGDAPQT